MRFLSAHVLAMAAIAPFVLAAAGSKEATPVSADDSFAIQTSSAEKNEVDDLVDDLAPTSTTFNNQEVPPIKALAGKALDDEIRDGYTIVKFFSPSCGHCIAAAPVFQTLYEFYWTSKPLASTSSGDQTMNDFHYYYNLDFASVDCIAFGDTCSKWKVNSYPTFIVFKEGESVKQLSGFKDMEGISEFIEEALEMIRPGSRTKGGPELPKVGAHRSPNFETSSVEHLEGAGTRKTTPTSSGEVGKAKKPLQSAKSSKPSGIPNALSTSVPLTAQSFQTSVTLSQEPWFVKFYAPWCPHCQTLAPTWLQMAKEMKGKLNIGEVNCDAESKLCKELHIHGYPTIVFFRGGERVDYDGLRGLGDIINYANKAVESGADVRDVDAAEFKEIEESEEVIFVYFYDHGTTSEDFAAMDRLILSLIGHAKLVKSNDAKLAERFKITTWPRLIVSRDGRPTYYTGLEPADMRDFRRMLQWMKSVWLPLVPELTASNSRDIMDGKIVVLGILSRDRPDEFSVAKNEIKSAAMEWMDKQTHLFQRERQDLRDAKQLRIEEAEARNDQRALRAAKSMRIEVDMSGKKEVGFAWVDGVFWERWIRTTYGIVVSEGEKVIINDEDNKRYWDTTTSGNFIIASRTSILETLPKVVSSPPKIKPKLTISNFAKVFFDIKSAAREHPILTVVLLVVLVFATTLWWQRVGRKGKGGFFRMEDKDLHGYSHGNGNGYGFGLLGGGGVGNGKVD